MKKVSVIIPCYNQAQFAEEAILSALHQTYPNIEIVCINDGSTDNSAEVIQKLAQKYKQIVFFDEKENRGVIASRNIAINAAAGEYILPLDADDTIEPEYIEEAVKVLDNNPDIGIVYSKARLFGIKNKEWKLPDYSKSHILYSNCIFVSALFRKKDFIALGGYKEYMKDGYEDWDLWLSFVENGFNVHRINKILFNYRKYKGANRSAQINKPKMINIYKNILKNHIKLYMEDESFAANVFLATEKKLKKYKKLYLCFLISNIFLIIIICALTIFLIGAK